MTTSDHIARSPLATPTTQSPRNLVLCCDGTSNEFAQDRTNVAKLAQLLIKEPDRQLVYYHPGVGTMAPPGFATGAGDWIARKLGLAFGFGLRNDIVHAYDFLIEHYRPGDRIFLFGFSRGAYTARAVAGLVHVYGLAMAGNSALSPYVVRMYWRIAAGHRREDSSYFQLADQYKFAFSSGDIPVHFLGVWDTVSSVGWIGSPVALPYTKENPAIRHARHAVAIDECRAFFRTNLLDRGNGDVREVWFPGTHCDVGGGHPEKESGLSKYALAWIVDEAEQQGLLVDAHRLAELLGEGNENYSSPSPAAPIHRSLKGYWLFLEFVPKKRRVSGGWPWRINLFRRRAMPKKPVVHDVVFQIDGYAERLPKDAIPLSRMLSADGAWASRKKAAYDHGQRLGG
jgi:uncharacterized protein (DUF2235 family)